MSGYSEKSLKEKLGLKSGYSVVFLYAPLSYIVSLGEIDDLEIFPTLKRGHDVVQLFVKQKERLIEELPEIMKSIKPSGCIWVSWPKKSSKVTTDITENTIREICLPLGLVDVKVAAIDETWSGLKLVVGLKNR
jgi:hypothetical protein